MRHLVEERQRIIFELDARVPDTTGQYERQIDVWLPDTREIIECKHHTPRVGIEAVDKLVGTTKDVNAAVGHIFSSSGFTPQALKRAQKAGITCSTLPFAAKFETFFPPTGGGYYVGEYIELCLCYTPPIPTGNTWGRISYFDKDDCDWPLCAAISIDWGNIKAHRFIAYLLLVHMLGRPPSDAAINDFVYEYGDRFEIGQEWVIREHEVGCFAIAETV
jgi:hypothetical protein